MQNTNSKEYILPYVHCSVIYNNQEPISRSVDKKAVEHLHNVILLSYKKEGTTGMDMESIMLSEIKQSKKNKYHMTSLICGI